MGGAPGTIHDWDDASCVRLLDNCRARLPAHGRVVCIDKVLPPMGDTSASGAKLLDMLMLVSLPGKERTEAGASSKAARLWQSRRRHGQGRRVHRAPR
jgi:hypothetical protein